MHGPEEVLHKWQESHVSLLTTAHPSTCQKVGTPPSYHIENSARNMSETYYNLSENL